MDRCLRAVGPVLVPVVGPSHHTSQTGVPNRSDRCPRVRTKSRSRDRIRLVRGIPCVASPPHPNKYEGSRPIEYHPIEQTYLPLFVSYLVLYPNSSFTNLICCSSFVSATSEGVLGGLADPRATLRVLAPTGFLSSLRYRSTTVISRRPVWPVYPAGLTGVNAEALRQLPLRAVGSKRCQQIHSFCYVFRHKHMIY
jgi:hypothetical protein